MNPPQSTTHTPNNYDLGILIAKNRTPNIEPYHLFLKNLGIENVQVVENGPEILEILESCRSSVDIVLMDIRMAKLDGIATTREILKRWPNPEDRPKIVAVAPQPSDAEIRRFRDAGIDHCLSQLPRKQDLESILPTLSRKKTWPLSPPPKHRSPRESPPPIDWRQFDMIVEEANSPCAAIFQKFVDSVPEILARIHKAIATNHSDEVASMAHQLKGSASAFGFVAFANAIGKIETAAKSGAALSPETHPQWESQMNAEFAAQRELVRRERGF